MSDERFEEVIRENERLNMELESLLKDMDNKIETQVNKQVGNISENYSDMRKKLELTRGEFYEKCLSDMRDFEMTHSKHQTEEIPVYSINPFKNDVVRVKRSDILRLALDMCKSEFFSW